MILECPNCQSCFTAAEWADSYRTTLAVFDIFTGNPIKAFQLDTEEDTYDYLYSEQAEMDCPECGEVCCIEDLTIC